MLGIREIMVLTIGLCLVGCGDDAPPAGGGGDASISMPDAMPELDAAAEAGNPGDAMVPAADLSGLPGEIAEAVCGALYRCCDGTDREQFFAPLAGTPGLERWSERFPPTVEFNQESCREVMAEVYAQQPFGSWMEGMEEHGVTFNEAAYDSCLADLESASCGSDLRAALFNGECFGWQPPAGGGRHRSLFTRTGDVGTPCRPIRDGIGAAYFGTCDPQVAFCCYEEPSRPEGGCANPFTADGEFRAGTCAPISEVGGACRALPPIQLCRTGLSCEPETGLCAEEGAATLNVGDACVDGGFRTLGRCLDGFCDLFDTRTCIAFREDGETCTTGDECRSGACNDRVCGPSPFCDEGGA